MEKTCKITLPIFGSHDMPRLVDRLAKESERAEALALILS
jgi:hypothetical protein